MLYANYHMPERKKSTNQPRHSYCMGLHHQEQRLPILEQAEHFSRYKFKPHKWFELKDWEGKYQCYLQLLQFL